MEGPTGSRTKVLYTVDRHMDLISKHGQVKYSIWVWNAIKSNHSTSAP